MAEETAEFNIQRMFEQVDTHIGDVDKKVTDGFLGIHNRLSEKADSADLQALAKQVSEHEHWIHQQDTSRAVHDERDREAKSRWQRWRGNITTGLAIAGSYLTIFVIWVTSAHH